jgi:hypothetical protein
VTASLPAVRRVREDLADFERAITDAALGGAGWRELLGRIRSATDRHCRLVDPRGALLAATDGGAGLSRAEASRALAEPRRPVIAEDRWRARALPAAAGGRICGLLLVAEPAGERQMEVARAALTAVLIESVRRSAAAESRFDDGAALIAALRRGAGIDDDISIAASRFGLDLGRAQCAAALRHTGTHHRTWATALSWLERPVEQQGTTAFTVVADPAELSRIRARLAHAVGDGAVVAACGSATTHPGDLRRSFDEAAALLRELCRRGGSELPFQDAGLLQVLLAVPPDRLRYFVNRHLGPVLDRPELLSTLQSWLASNGSRRSVSEELHLHRNSVGYRVGLLKQLLGLDPLDPEQSAVLHAALVARQLLGQDSPQARPGLETMPIPTEPPLTGVA